MKLGVPSKGRLKKEVLSWFNHKGIEIITPEDDWGKSDLVKLVADYPIRCGIA